MPENLPRPLIIIAGIIAILVVVFGVRDYVQKKDTQSSAGVSTPTVTSPAVKAEHKKAGSSKSRHERGSTSDANARAAKHGEEQVRQKAMTNQIFASADEKEIDDLQDSAGGRTTGKKVKSGLQQVELSSEAECLPLPNLVQHGDVDANWYENWAREYKCFY